METCGTCKFVKPIEYKDEIKKTAYQCRRYPPVPNAYSCSHPFVVKDGWCGEWVEKLIEIQDEVLK